MPAATLLESAATSIEMKVANRSIDSINRHYSFIAEQVASLAKWLTASLLAINGGGVLAALEALKDKHDVMLPAGFFIAGIILAMLSGVALQEVYNRFSANLGVAYQYWNDIKDGLAHRDENIEIGITKTEAFWNRAATIPPVLGWISGTLFLVGCVLMALRLGS